MRLESNCEIVGILSKIKHEGSHIRLVFTVPREVELPSDAFSYDELKKYLDHRIGIGNFDGKIFLRKIKKR